MISPEVYERFNPDRMIDFFEARGWKVSRIPQFSVDLVNVTTGAALECGDGRFDQVPRLNKTTGKNVHGIRILGGVNAIMAMITGGDEEGLEAAAELLIVEGVTPGTHSAEQGGCGYADLWIAGQLESAIYPYELGGVDKGGLKIGIWLRQRLRDLGGRHFRLNGNHKEEAVRINPFIGRTEVATDTLRFRVDDWFMAGLGVRSSTRLFQIAETVEKLKPNAMHLEIIVP